MEVFLRSNCSGIFITIREVFFKVVNILNSKYISDHWKEIALPYYASILFISSIKVLMVFSIIILIFSLSKYFKNDLAYNFITIFDIFESIAVCFLYSKIRKSQIE